MKNGGNGACFGCFCSMQLARFCFFHFEPNSDGFVRRKPAPLRAVQKARPASPTDRQLAVAAIEPNDAQHAVARPCHLIQDGSAGRRAETMHGA